MRWPSLDTNHFRVSHAWHNASARSAPCSDIVVVARTSRSPLSDERNRERIDRALARPRSGDRHARQQRRRAAGHEGAGRGDLGGLGAGAAHGRRRGRRRRRTPIRSRRGPARRCPSRRPPIDRLDLAVARRHRRSAGASPARRRSGRPRRGPPGPPRSAASNSLMPSDHRRRRTSERLRRSPGVCSSPDLVRWRRDRHRHAAGSGPGPARRCPAPRCWSCSVASSSSCATPDYR